MQNISRSSSISTLLVITVLMGGASMATAQTALLDDFSDNDFINNPTWEVLAGTSWSAANGNLTGNQQTGTHVIRTPSTQAYGTWLWNFRLPDISSFLASSHTFFIASQQFVTTPFTGGAFPSVNRRPVNGYSVEVGKGSFRLFRFLNAVDQSTGITMLASSTWSADDQPHLIRVTRDTQGNFQVFLDGLLKLTATDNSVTASEQFHLWMEPLGTPGRVSWDNIRVPAPPAVAATVDIDPNTLNLKSNGQFITAYIELPSGFDVNNIDVASVTLSSGTGSVSALTSPTSVGDHDNDGIPDRMVKFSRSAVQAIVSTGSNTLTVSGTVGSTPFEGSDTIRVI